MMEKRDRPKTKTRIKYFVFMPRRSTMKSCIHTWTIGEKEKHERLILVDLKKEYERVPKDVSW